MYTWGYIKNATLCKMDLSADAAIDVKLVEKFPFYANEAMTQICGAIKPKHTLVKFVVVDAVLLFKQISNQTGITDFSFLDYLPSQYDLLSDEQKEIVELLKDVKFTNESYEMPDDFISFGNEVNYRHSDSPIEAWEEANDTQFVTMGYKQIMFNDPGVYQVSYNARWLTFYPDMQDDDKLDIPADIADCIPSYIASQCFKIDDEQKAQIYRNEYEMFLARMDGDDYQTNKTIKITGGW